MRSDNCGPCVCIERIRLLFEEYNLFDRNVVLTQTEKAKLSDDDKLTIGDI